MLEREIDPACDRCKGTGVAIVSSTRGRRQYTSICSCAIGRSIAAGSVRPMTENLRRHG